MPKIQWEQLPREKWSHLRERAKERKISAAELFALAEWKAEDPDVPEGDWYKDFGSFKLCGTGKFPSTFLLRGRPLAANVCRNYGCSAMAAFPAGPE
jgi:hypothetical protein